MKKGVIIREIDFQLAWWEITFSTFKPYREFISLAKQGRYSINLNDQTEITFIYINIDLCRLGDLRRKWGHKDEDILEQE